MARSYRDNSIDQLVDWVNAHLDIIEPFQAFRLLENMAGLATNSGKSVRVVFHVANHLHCSATDIAWVKYKPSANVIEITINYMGLTGESAILPSHYTELLMRQKRQKNMLLPKLIQVIQARSIEAFHRAKEKTNFYQYYERKKLKIAPQDQMHTVLKSLAGINPSSTSVKAPFMVAFLPFFNQRVRSVLHLKSLVAAYVNYPIRIQEFTPNKVYLSLENQSCISSGAGQSFNNILGETLVLGHMVRMDVFNFSICVLIENIEKLYFLQLWPVMKKQIMQLCQLFIGQHCTYSVCFECKGSLTYQLGVDFVLF